MKEMTISAVRCRRKPKRGLMAKWALEAAREFYRDPENEKAFQEWKKRTGAGGKG